MGWNKIENRSRAIMAVMVISPTSFIFVFKLLLEEKNSHYGHYLTVIILKSCFVS